MSESKGISLRRKKTTRPTISAPRQISSTTTAQASAPPPSQSRDRSADSRNPSLWETQTNASGNTTTTRPGLSSDKTSDLVKRRYSTRFAGGVPHQNGFQDGLAPPVPAIPSLPAQYAQQRRPSSDSRSPSRDGRSPSRDGGPRIRVDVRALKDPNLQAESYVQTILSEASAPDIQSYSQELETVKTSTNLDLQHNVYQNRTQFIKISKEAEKLKTELRSLRTLMSELTSTLSHATTAGGLLDDLGAPGSRLSMISTTDRKRSNRSSVANLEAMWSSQLQILWKRVEGSQKFLPALPGRHILVESQRWVELNSATWKPRRRVALVLLNDHLLVASEKKRTDPLAGQNGQGNGALAVQQQQGQSQVMLTAERCWALQDVSLADISSPSTTPHKNGSGGESKTLANAINIRAGSESLTYATSDPTEKLSLLVAFRKAQEDLRKSLAAEHSVREKKLDDIALLTGRDPRLLKKAAQEQLEAERAAGGGGLNRSGSVLIDVEGRQQSIRYVEKEVDGLDIDIALQRFEEAVEKIEKLRKLARSIKGNQVAQGIILEKVQERASKLAGVVARNLSYTSSGTDATKRNVSWLLRLGCEEMARVRYLDARTETIRVRTRQLPFTGALAPYLHALSFTTFTLLVHTFRTYALAFPAPGSGSAVVAWGMERVGEFNGVLGRQMDGVLRGGEVWEECVEVVRGQVGVLAEVGVDFSGVVGKGVWDEGAGTGGGGKVKEKGGEGAMNRRRGRDRASEGGVDGGL
ncbi:exocyst complex component exo84 [Elasticomyces elasticus]|nr:exocyst complex component exo84 [Elasticomyces elasticus]KAK3664154.1 exocyst complex component exo84 [Elasticomyces elasticus]KAK4927723.1 exocyst complex component exo84 [Elasticomyces elasticus]KAK5767094.1 exocyst complex component exo84 [Elasticomyces elasticus]